MNPVEGVLTPRPSSGVLPFLNPRTFGAIYTHILKRVLFLYYFEALTQSMVQKEYTEHVEGILPDLLQS